MRREFLAGTFLILALNVAAWVWNPVLLWNLVLIGPILMLGFVDFFQIKQAVRRNFPVIGRFRYLLELIRPEIQQYFIENNTDGMPFSREQRSVVYQRAKKSLDTLPFGTQRAVYEPGYEWVTHSIRPSKPKIEDLRILIGGPECKRPYSASVFNVSAMSFGALSKNAVLALSGAAKKGNFSMNTGEGGIAPYHLEPGGDLVWQIGTGYFGCRNDDGTFSPEKFTEKATLPNVKMVEIKLSQGAKPGHGGILPARKVTSEISKIRGVPMGKVVLSPPGHSAFSTPIEMLQFIARLRKLSGGKPVGFKFCVGKRREVFALAKAMVETGITPDFITVDGGEGGTGAAPLEFSNYVGFPLTEGLVFVHNVLAGFSLRKNIKIICSGKVTEGFDLIKKLAIGADAVNSARAMMMALGCIQALRCNTNACPTGVATQDPSLVSGLVVMDKVGRVVNYHHETVHSVGEILGALGLSSPKDLKPWHIMKRISYTEVKHYGELFEFVSDGEFLKGRIPKSYERAHHAAVSSQFEFVE